MTNHARVTAAINFQKTDFVPYQAGFTLQAYETAERELGEAYISRIINHLACVDLGKPEVEIKPGYFRDEYAVVWNKTGADKDIGVPDFYLITDWESFRSYRFPEVDEAYIRGRCEELLSWRGDYFKGAMIGFSLFERLWTLVGLENTLCNMILEPDLIHALLEKICRRNLEVLDIALEYEMDYFQFGDDWGQQKGLIMGLPYWRNFIKPYLKQMYEKVKKSGKYIIQHSCGDIREIMDELSELGLDVYQTFQPEIYGLSYSEKLRGKIAVWGGISTQQDLPNKTPEEIRKITRATLDHFREYGGLIAGPTHSIPGDVPAENMKAMFDVFMNQD